MRSRRSSGTWRRGRRCVRPARRCASTCGAPGGRGPPADGADDADGPAARMPLECQWPGGKSIVMNGYRLVRRAPGAQRPHAPERPGRLEHGPDGGLARSAPRLDDAQQRVVDHQGGPLLVLAGPGTGKTTTIVEAVAERIENRGIDPGRILVLTFSRK